MVFPRFVLPTPMLLICAGVFAAPMDGFAQDELATLTGSVADSAGTPVGSVIVSISGAAATFTTNESGVFQIPGVPPGSFTVVFSKEGFDSAEYQAVIPREHGVVVSFGRVVLHTADASSAILSVQVTEENSDLAVAGATVEVNGRNVGVTAENGRLRVKTSAFVRGEQNGVTVRRLGYRPIEHKFVLAQEPAVELNIHLLPAAVELEAVDVEGEGMVLRTGRMPGFFDRRRMGLGEFFTRDEIKSMGAQKATDGARRIPGATVYNTNENVTTSRPEMMDRVWVQFQRGGLNTMCIPLVFVNDIQVDARNLDAIINIQQVVGMEVYKSLLEVPPQYNRIGAECGVFVFWMDATEGAASFAKRIEFGFQFGARVRNGTEGERIGILFNTRVYRGLELQTAMRWTVGRVNAPPPTGWEIMVIPRFHPFGGETPWYVGTGLSLMKIKPTVTDGGFTLNEPVRVEKAHVVVSGIAFPAGPVRLFVEGQLIDPLVEGLGVGLLLFGFTLLQ